MAGAEDGDADSEMAMIGAVTRPIVIPTTGRSAERRIALMDSRMTVIDTRGDVVVVMTEVPAIMTEIESAVRKSMSNMAHSKLTLLIEYREKSEVKDEVEKVDSDKKRAREDDDGGEQPAKKVDTKAEVATEAS